MTCPDGCCPAVVVDLFSGAGGAAMGLHRAWPHARIIGVDNRPMPHYPFEHVVADAMTYPLDGADFVWASPPCQGYSTMTNRRASVQPMLIGAVRERLLAHGSPFTIENVEGVVREMRHPIKLCGSAFGLGVWRHRYFESSSLVLVPGCDHRTPNLPVYGKLDGRRVWTRVDGSQLRAARTLAQASAAMGIDWMEWDELREAIPPAYSEYIARSMASQGCSLCYGIREITTGVYSPDGIAEVWPCPRCEAAA